MEEAVNAAKAAVKGGRAATAINLLHEAALAQPMEKAPWVEMARIRYDAGDYGQAIVLAQQALLRDSDDIASHSIAAVSGLRVASGALADLVRINKLSDSPLSQAQYLAKLLRTNLREDQLVPREQCALRAGKVGTKLSIRRVDLSSKIQRKHKVRLQKLADVRKSTWQARDRIRARHAGSQVRVTGRAAHPDPHRGRKAGP